jgi:hypothetical protein
MLGWQYGTSTTMPWGISQASDEYKYHPINVYKLMITVPILFWLWKKSKILLGTGHLLRAALIYVGMGLMAVTLFKQKQPLIIGLSGEQFVYLLMMLSGYALFQSMGRRRTAE